jgi:PKD repeat protein
MKRLLITILLLITICPMVSAWDTSVLVRQGTVTNELVDQAWIRTSPPPYIGIPYLVNETNPQVLMNRSYVWKVVYGSSAAAGYHAAAYGESIDGIHFAPYTGNPNLALPIGEGDSFVKINDTTYYEWKTMGGAYGVGEISLYSVAQNDFINRTLIQEGVLLPSGTGFDSQYVANHVVWYEDGKYHMLYEAKGSNWAIGYANSTDGKTWTKYSGNPVISGAGARGGANNIFKFNGTYWLFYHGSLTGNLPAVGYLAHSSYPWGPWTELPQPIFIADPTDAGYGTAVYQTSDVKVVENNGKMYYYYMSTSDGTSGSVGAVGKLAIANMTIEQFCNYAAYDIPPSGSWITSGDHQTMVSGSYTLAKWTTAGIYSWTVPSGVTAIDYVVVAGGGAGGNDYGNAGGGGGGSGGQINGTNMGLSAGNVLNITVGAGGTPSSANVDVTGGNGTHSVIAIGATNTSLVLAATGGGGGGQGNKNGQNGGSGGGTYSTRTPGTGITGQGHNGAAGSSASHNGGGGGQGGTADGSNNGGIGLINFLTGDILGGGGGGGGDTSSNGGSSIGGAGGSTTVNGTSGTAATGSGGGGAGGNSIITVGGAGGSGIVILRYLTPPPAPIISFTSDITSGTSPLAVQFTDHSIGNPTGWNWSFGDGDFSTLQNPLHVFSTGNWLVNLNVTNASGYNNTLLDYGITVSGGSFPTYNGSSLYVSQYPPAFNSTYVNATTYRGSTWEPYLTCNPTTSLTGTSSYNSWEAQTNVVTNQRFNIDLGSAKEINRIYYENGHNNGASLNTGVKDFTVWGSNTQGSFDNVSYSNDTGWTQITASQTSFDIHTGADTTDQKYINLASVASYRYYSFKFVNNYGDTNYMNIRRIELQELISWEYTTPGTYTWQCPSNITNITVQFAGGGSSGTPSDGTLVHGGSAGATLTVPFIAVTPGTNYSIIVGAGGARANSGSTRNNGGLSSGFGQTVLGGSTTTDSIDGGNGYFSIVQFAENGGGGTIFLPGHGGLGYGAGGGAGGYTYPATMFYGGKGADGYIMISNSSLFTGTKPDFVASTTTDFAGAQITFRDMSTNVNATALSYLWNFGDGYTSDTIGTVSHTYSYTGTFTVSLTLNNSGGNTVTETKNEYINIVSKPSTFSTPRTVSFIFTDYYNTPLSGLTINVTPLDATIPTSWFTEYYGIGSGVTLTSTGFTGVTGNDGSWAAPMSETIRYSFLMTNATAGISGTQTFYPTDLKYVIHVPTSTTIAGNNTLIQMANTSLPVYQLNATAYNLSVIYHDSSGLTTNVLFLVKWRNGTSIYTHDLGNPGTGVVADNYTIVNPGIGKEVIWMYNATRSGI